MDNRLNDTAGPALRGFRLQILYTLARLTEPRTACKTRLWPEGIEGLAIFDDWGQLREPIQRGQTFRRTHVPLLVQRRRQQARPGPGSFNPVSLLGMRSG
jgi:hypothetical protein